jgi:hypothetical protein
MATGHVFLAGHRYAGCWDSTPRAEVDEFMKRAGIAFDYTLEDFEHDAETSRHLKETRAKELHGQ